MVGVTLIGYGDSGIRVRGRKTQRMGVVLYMCLRKVKRECKKWRSRMNVGTPKDKKHSDPESRVRSLGSG